MRQKRSVERFTHVSKVNMNRLKIREKKEDGERATRAFDGERKGEGWEGE